MKMQVFSYSLKNWKVNSKQEKKEVGDSKKAWDLDDRSVIILPQIVLLVRSWLPELFWAFLFVCLLDWLILFVSKHLQEVRRQWNGTVTTILFLKQW
jgi:hypothetical protein